MADDALVFDRELLKRRRTRALNRYSQADFLFKWARTQLGERLLDINRTFDDAVQIGSRGILGEHEKIQTLHVMDITPMPFETTPSYLQATEEFFPFQAHSLDLVLSTLNLHTVNDLPGTLLQIKRALNPDGLFLACMLGGETLHELRQVMMETELELYGGVSPRVAPFADKPQMGDLLQRAGFALPIVDSDIVTVTYEHAFKLFQDLRFMGESNVLLARNINTPGKAFFSQVAQRYQDLHGGSDGRIVASFEVIFLLGWAPHHSQQQPLRPGSAEHRLADALDSSEIHLNEKAKP